MKWTGVNELREKFLQFFESKGHTRLKSYPLVPQGDNSLLLINSGMAPMKKYFLGEETPPNKRVTTCQKCIRTPDIENVGKTERHGTYFEMLGNFSFGDYFKHEAVAWAWEFITKEMEMPEDKLWITIYEDDDEAFEIWNKEIGVPAERIVRMGKEDNFWEIGSGPCGPCSEIYFDRGEEHGCGSPDCGVACECDRYVEFWNLVFSQFDSDGEGNYAKMEHPNIDTGMGLERLACIMQGVDNLFEVDTVRNILNHVSSIAGVPYKQDETSDISLRVVTDHIRSTVFMIADGVMPSNEGRGYVLRRLLRRAARHGKLLGINEPFLYQVVDTVINENEAAYPELREKEGYIKKLVRVEEESFAKTIDKGNELLTRLLDEIEAGQMQQLSGEAAFKLYDTFGFPIDLTKEIISEKGVTVDEEEFVKLMEEQRTRAREARNKGEVVSWTDHSLDFLGQGKTEFVGYTDLTCNAKVLGLLKDGKEATSAAAGDEVVVILDTTPFYAESGGQAADTGVLAAQDLVIRVTDCQKDRTGYYLHAGVVESGVVEPGDSVTASVNREQRQSTMRNHTAAHLLQAALRRVLGDHVHQAGQLVNADRMRFDFSHFEAVTPKQLQEIEHQVNRAILQAIPVNVYETDQATARAEGAMALFSEKYGDVVRVVRIADESMELCGGTHAENTAQLGLFKIVSESSVAAGVRRIEAVTGSGVLELLNTTLDTVQEAASVLKTTPNELCGKIRAQSAELKEAQKEIEKFSAQQATQKAMNLFDKATRIGDVQVIGASLHDVSTEALRQMGDVVREQADDVVAVICSICDGKGTMLCVCGKAAVEAGAHAGRIVKKTAALAGGKGGGRPESAMAGVPDIFRMDEALAQLPDVVRSVINS